MTGADDRRVAISGAGGFVGAALARSLTADGWRVLRLVRRRAGSGEVGWDPERGEIENEKLEGIDAVVHLAGENIAGVWTPAKRRRIMESRARGTRLIAEAMTRLRRPPGIFVSASGVDYYGDAGETVLTEESPAGDSFLARVCVAWEAATKPAADAGLRVVNCRFGLVLHPSGGALKLMLPAFRFGLGARLGSGRQWLSWVARRDAVRIIRFAMTTADLVGPLNATSPEPVRNEEFTRVIAASVNRPAFLTVPSVILRTFTGGMAGELALSSKRAVPEALTRAGFRFDLPRLEAAVEAGVD
jgi:uncharacterized protein